ncbi:iron ABC transporter permease [Amylibacter sp. SFDW26]|uniref:FecCD family ABC transporter permease n=1 Tax=Amylibacter sp. SFDW26 TaxID=2652722 RepID=UPI001261BD57|nr:iron ABC transporter permease [Amylibacter sp. SFDW26]KAB7613900.1 iron ABC transporter permease [Amylibacter sp. SFDW26]
MTTTVETEPVIQKTFDWSRLYWPLAGIVAIFAAILAGLMIGETQISAITAFKTIANKMWSAGYDIDLIDQGILWEYRLPRAIVAASCGAALAVSGVVLQALLRNALADPYILGLSAGASTGAVLVSIAGFGAGAISMSTGAFGGAIIAFIIVAGLAKLASGRGGAAQFVLAGIAGSQLFNALTSFIIAKSASADQARGIMFWLLGNLSGVRWFDVVTAAPVALLGVFIVFLHARSLDAFTFGTDAAASVGVAIRRVQITLISITALLTAIMVSIVGSIGFVGLVIPHAARYLVGVRHKALIPTAAIIGAVFLVLADIVARVIIPGQVLPIGVVTALVGAPAFAIILIKGQR